MNSQCVFFIEEGVRRFRLGACKTKLLGENNTQYPRDQFLSDLVEDINRSRV